MIEGSVTVSDKEFAKKVASKNYYECSLVVIMQVVRFVFSNAVLERIKVADKDNKTKFLANNSKYIVGNFI